MLYEAMLLPALSGGMESAAAHRLQQTGGKVRESALGAYRWPSSWTCCVLVIKGLKRLIRQWMPSFHLYSATSKASALPLRQAVVCFSIQAGLGRAVSCTVL